MLQPAPAALGLWAMPAHLVTTWVCRVTLAPPIEGDVPMLNPTLLKERAVAPATA
jgi:hypothetical protein